MAFYTNFLVPYWPNGTKTIRRIRNGKMASIFWPSFIWNLTHDKSFRLRLVKSAYEIFPFPPEEGDGEWYWYHSYIWRGEFDWQLNRNQRLRRIIITPAVNYSKRPMDIRSPSRAHPVDVQSSSSGRPKPVWWTSGARPVDVRSPPGGRPPQNLYKRANWTRRLRD